MMMNLKCVTLRFMNNEDMIKTPLRVHDDSHLLDDALVIVWTINEHS
jgi:hypothetical protein